MIQVVTQFAGGVFLILLAGCVLLATYYFTYAVIWGGFNFGIASFWQLAFGKATHLHHQWISRICFTFILLLFIENFRIHREYWSSYTVKYKVSPAATWWTGGLGAGVALLANADASAKIISDILLTGPRLLMAGVLSFAQAIKFTSFNRAECALALVCLLKAPHRVSLTELLRNVPTLTPVSLLFQLQGIEGVLLLGKAPAGFTLTPELRAELAALPGKIEIEPEEAGEDHSQDTPSEDDPYRILGLTPPCSLDEIKAAYGRCAKEFNPDHFANEVPEFRAWAEERTAAINAAYEALLNQAEQ